MENTFSELGVIEPIVKAVTEMGFNEPTKVQQESIPQIIDGKDLIVLSKTGSGKTAAFGIPIIQGLSEIEDKGPRALILAPTRELAVQVDQEINKMAKHLSLTTTAVYGQHNINTEINAIKNGAMIISGTPGRVFDHIERRTLNTKNIQYLVLDEADRMLDMGFIDQVIGIIKKLPRERVTLLFSATMPPEIQRICKSYMNSPTSIELETETKTVDSIKQIYYRVGKDEKRTQLDRVLKYTQPDSCMIFCNTRIEVDRVQHFLHQKGYHVEALHGANKQHQRMKTISKFKEGKIQIMVATDVAARGIHIDDLSCVINYDVPEDKNSYVHRIGRTGRAGNSGLAVGIVTSDDIMTLYEIEEHVGCLIEEVDLPTDEVVAEAVEKAKDSKWAKMAPPKPRQPKEHKNITNGTKTHKAKGSYKTSKSTGLKEEISHIRSGDGKPRETEYEHKHKVEAHQVKKSHHHNKNVHKQKTPERKTKVVMTKMGPIEMIVNDNEKPTLIERIKGWFKMS